MEVVKTLKEHPWKSIAASSTTIIAIVGAMFALDARYAHAADVDKDRKQVHQAIKEATLTLRQQMIEDRLFELDVKKEQSTTGRLSPSDAALSARYRRQLDEIIKSKVIQ